jgi:arsenate reductase
MMKQGEAMSQFTIWHNPRCRKSREGLQFLRDKGVDPEIYEYLKDRIDASHLAVLIEKSGQAVETFIRTNEADYKALGLKGKTLSAQEFAELASKYPKLLQRPIVVRGEKVVLGQPPQEIDVLLKER